MKRLGGAAVVAMALACLFACAGPPTAPTPPPDASGNWYVNVYRFQVMSLVVHQQGNDLTGWWCAFDGASIGVYRVRRISGTFPSFTTVPEEPGELAMRAGIYGADVIFARFGNDAPIYRFTRSETRTPDDRTCNR